MNIKHFNKNESYAGKWCLYKQYNSLKGYDSIYVIDIVDGIVKYVYEETPDISQYENVDTFERYESFLINPIQMPPPKMRHTDVSTESNTNEYCNKSNANGQCGCKHEWCYSDLESYPPIHTRRCIKCGKEEYIPRGCNNPDGWIDGRGY